MDRSSGILLPVSALPGPCGIGDLGKAARDFIDFLAAAGQRYWQILPLNPPDGAHSPYLSASTFAGSTDLLSPEPFVARGALTLDEVRAIDWGSDPMRVDYARVHAGRTALWDMAFARERDAVVPALRAALAAEPWLRDYCLYMALKEEQGGAPWYAWPQPLRDRDAAARAEALERLDDRVLLHAYLQTEFTRQWDAVRAYAHAHGVRIIGDLPMYVAPDSADVWAQPAQFCLDPDGLVQRRRTALGQPALRLGCHARGRLPVVEGAHPRRSKALRCGAYRPFSRHFELLGGATRRTDRPRRPLGARPRPGAAAGAAHGSAGVGTHRRGPRHDRRRCAPARRALRLPGYARAALRLRPQRHVRAPARPRARAQRLLCRHARQRARRRAPPTRRRSAARTPTMPCAASACTMSRACRRRCCAPAWVRARSCSSRRCRTCSVSAPRAA